MKKIVGLIIVLLALLLAAYYGMGIMTEKTVKRDIVTLNKSPRVKVKLANYQRGFFSSTASLDWQFHVPEHAVESANGQPEIIPAQNYEVQMPLNIYHGPIIFANKTVKFGMGYAKTDIPLPEKYQEQFKANFTEGSVAPKLNLSIFVSYLRNSHLQVAVPPFKLLDREGGAFNWQGMASTFEISPNAKKIKGGMTIDGMSLSKDVIKAKMDKIQFDYNVYKWEAGLYLGEANLSLSSLLVNKQRSQGYERLFEISTFSLNSASDGKDGLFNSRLKMKVDKLFVQEKQFGPAQLDLAIKNLDAAVMADINRALNQAQRGNELENQKLMFALLPEVPKLLAHEAEFEISELSFVMPEGKIEGNLYLKLPKDKNANPFELLSHMQGKGRLKVPAQVVKTGLAEFNRQRIAAHLVPMQPQAEPNPATPAAAPTPETAASTSTPAVANPATPAETGAPTQEDIAKQTESLTQTQLDSMLQSGLLVAEGDYYVIDAVFNDGKLMVNGKPFNSAMIRF